MVGVVGHAVGEAEGDVVHEVVAVAAVERLGEEKALVLEEGIPLGADAEGRMETQHGLEVVVGAVGHIADFLFRTIDDSQADERIEGNRREEVLVVDMEERGVEVPHELGASEEEERVGGAVGLEVAGGHADIEGQTESQRLHEPTAEIQATGRKTQLALAGMLVDIDTGIQRPKKGIVCCRLGFGAKRKAHQHE